METGATRSCTNSKTETKSGTGVVFYALYREN